MLVLSRKTRESIIIREDIVITIVDIGRGRVQIGVRAPSYVPVFRQEIVERMMANGEIEAIECCPGDRPGEEDFRKDEKGRKQRVRAARS